jgi:hypothetical protein
MQRRSLVSFLPSAYESSGIESVFDPAVMADGSRNVLITGKGKPTAFRGMELVAGKTGSRYLTQAGESYAGLGSFANTSGKGSVVRVMAGLFFAGTGALYYDGASLGANASSILQLKLLASGAFGTTYQAGLSQPSAPTIASRTSLGVGKSGKNKAGTYSLKIYKIRSATGARSNASPASNITTVTESGGVGQSIRVTFPTIGSNGEDRWGIAVTPRNFGSTGPFFLLQEVAEADLTTIDSVARSYEIEWSDGDLAGKPLAPVESSPPPSCVFVGALGNSVFVDGCYGDTVAGVSAASPGTVIACSLPLRPEEFPLDWLAFPPDAPTCLLRGGDGFYYRMGKNSTGVISYTGGEPPVSYQLLWGATGVQYPHNAVVAEGGRLYMKSGNGLVRIGDDGQPESLWATPIEDDIRDWDDEFTVLGWDENNKQVCIMNGTTVIPFNTTLDKPGAPLDISEQVSGDIVSAVTHLGAMYISCLDEDDSTIRLYRFNTGTGSIVEVYTDWFFSEAGTDYIRQIDLKMRCDSTNDITMRVYKNQDLTTPMLDKTFTPPVGKPIDLTLFRGLLGDLRSFCVYLSQETEGGDSGFERIDVSGYSKAIAGGTILSGSGSGPAIDGGGP